MHADHIDESRTAGSGAHLAFLVCFVPFLCFGRSGQVAPQTHFEEISESHLFQSLAPAAHADFRTVLSFDGRRRHGVNFLSGLQCFDDRHDGVNGANSAERAVVHAAAAADALFFVDAGQALFVIADGVHRTALLARPLQMNNGVVRAGLRTLAALLALGGINDGAMRTGLDRTELAGAEACLPQTASAVICNRIAGDRTVRTGRFNDLHDIPRVNFGLRLPQGETNPPSDDLPFLVYTTSVVRQRTRNDLLRKILRLLQLSLKSQLRYLINHLVTQTQNTLISLHFKPSLMTQTIPSATADDRLYTRNRSEVYIIHRSLTTN